MEKTHTFTLLRSARRSLSIEITPHAEIIVRAPLHISQDRIEKFLNEKNDWIEKLLAKMLEHKKRQYMEGEEFFYLGNIYKLKIGNYKKIHIDTSSGQMNFPNFLTFRIKEEISGWYIKQAREIIKERVEHYSKVMQTQYISITFSDTKSKWGSCSPDNALQFNWRLIMAPLLVIDYVVVHELAHISEKNHSRNFWRKVEIYKPAYRQYRDWLHANSSKLVL